MDVVKRKRSKGGFLNLFDWPGKPRKKLFSNSSEIYGESRQERENVQNSSKPRLSVSEVDEIGKSSVYNLRSDSSCCASSVTSDDGQGGRAPSVVARLMGLESLPVPNASEPRLNPDLDPFFLRSSHSANTWDRYKTSGYVNLRSDVDGVPWDHMDSIRIKGHNRPLERYQTETLPPRSAKPISVTHNRLLSPIRSPGFVPSKNPAYVMEAASRMIEPSPRVVTRARVSPIGSSSVPLRFRDLKEKLEAASKTPNPQFSNATPNSKYLRDKQNEKRSVASAATPGTSKVLGRGVSDGLKGKVKPSSLSGQTKASFHMQDDSTPSNGNKKISTGQKGSTEAKNRIMKSQNGDSGPSLNTSKTVLKQNNQKQNCRDRHQASKASVPKQQSKKVMNKVVNKVLVESEIGSASRKFGSPPLLTGNDVSLPFPRKKNLQNKKHQNAVQETRTSNVIQIRKGEKSIKCNITVDNDLPSDKDDRKKDMDVISFTFSSSIKGISSTSRSSSQGTERDSDSAVSFNVRGGDSLNALLEQKLRELTSKIESSSCSLIQEGSLDSTSKEGVSVMISSPSKSEKSIQNSMDKGLSEIESTSDCTSLDDNRKIQMTRSEEHEISSISTVTDADEPGVSCNRSRSDCIVTTAAGCSGWKMFSSDQDATRVSTSGSHRAEDETEFPKSVATIAFSEGEERHVWETDYITEILSSDQLMLEEFALGMAQDVLPVSLFHETDSQGDLGAKIERKTLFDCINECLTLKCERIFTGSCKGLGGKHGILLGRRDLLAEELNREIQGLKNTREMMVDELVDSDMSSPEGRWLEYEKEAYEEGIEISREIVSALVDDLVDDLMSVS